MADISAMCAQLHRVRQELIGSPLFVGGRPNDNNKAVLEAARLERLASEVALIIRDLNSAESLLRLRQLQVRKVPDNQQYAARQSLDQLLKNLALLRDDAQSLAELIRDLLDRNGLLNPIQKGKSFLDLIKDLEKAAGHEAQSLISQPMHAAKHDVISAAQTNPPPATIGSVLNLVVFVYLGIKVAQRKLQPKSTGA